MKKILKASVLTAAIIGCGATGALADLVLFDWGVNINGIASEIGLGGDSVPSVLNVSSFDTNTGLGTITYMSSVSGYFGAFFDIEIDQDTNTFFNEYGSVMNTPAATQSWEIGDPFALEGIYDNFLAGSLDDTNAVPSGSEDDVSMAMGWDFTLAADEMATITLTLSDVAPISGFYLAQVDPDSQESIYFSSNLTIGGDGSQVPEPAMMLLMGTCVVGLFGINRRRMKK